jgi:hypothetical protein
MIISNNPNLVSIWCAGEKNPNLISLFESLKDIYKYDIDANAWGEHGHKNKSDYQNVLYVIHGDKNDDFDRLKTSYDFYIKELGENKIILTSDSQDTIKQLPKFKEVEFFMNISEKERCVVKLKKLFDSIFSKETKPFMKESPFTIEKGKKYDISN